MIAEITGIIVKKPNTVDTNDRVNVARVFIAHVFESEIPKANCGEDEVLHVVNVDTLEKPGPFLNRRF